MMLQPRKFKYNTRQKRSSTATPSSFKLSYGNLALVLLNPFRISANRIFRLNLFLKRSSRKSDWTKRSFWVAIFPHLPLSRKPNGMSMGNGAGKLSTWYTQLRGGNSLVEFNNLRPGRAAHFSNQVAHNLPVPSVFYQQTTSNLKLVGSRRTNPNLYMFW